MDAGLKDVGSCSSLWDVPDKDEMGNATSGEEPLDSKNSFVRTDEVLFCIVGLENVVVFQREMRRLLPVRTA